jgi:predicted RNA binding protein YcfA (HicA-like mRNA interferase family)
MPKLRVLSGKEIVKIFSEFRFEIVSQRGSHVKLKRILKDGTKQTLTIPFIVDRRLREINYGDFNGKLKELIDSIKEKYIKEPFPNGESYEQAVARVQEFFKELKEKYSDKTVLVIGHRATQYGLEVMVGQKTLKECLKTPFRWQPYWEYSL